MSRRLAALAAALCLAVACGPGRIVRHGEVDRDALATVRQGLSAVRGLAFTAPVPVRVLPPEALAANLARELDYTYRPGDLERLARVYARLGLVRPGIDLRQALSRLYQGQVAAYYDPRAKDLALATGALRAGGVWVELFTTLTGRDLVGETLVAHELTHALQDQHYGLPTEPEPLTDSHGDRLLARRALLEGDATLAGFTYVRGSALDAATIDWIEHELHAVPTQLAEEYPDIPELVRTSLALQYDEGTAFAGWALGAGGWPAVDRVEADPPESTEQVLHPARYYGARDRPVAIALGGTEELEAAGWRRTYEDTLGELDVRALFHRVLPTEGAARVADGWGGDRLRVLERGAQMLLVWMTAWDAPSDAIEFADALATALPDAHRERRDDRVLVIVDAPDAARLAPRLWARTRVDRSGRPAS